MAYWWVSQNKTHRQERDGGYLWAPKNGSGGVIFTHWSNMTLVHPGDVIFSYANQSIGAIGVASSSAYDAPQPDELGGVWEPDGRRIDVVYRTVTPPVPISTFVDALIERLPDRNSPITTCSPSRQKRDNLFASSLRSSHLLSNWLLKLSCSQCQIRQHETRLLKPGSVRDVGVVTCFVTGPGSVQ
jgi:hypothetical protein